MAEKTKHNIAPERIALYDELIATLPDIERKGAAMPYTSLNGNMFSFLLPDGTLTLRLSKTDREKFLQQFENAIVEQHGAVLKEYVSVPEEILANIDEAKKYFRASYDYAQTLKPKPTKK